MFDTSIIEISKKALKNNIVFIQSNLKRGVRLSSVIKGNAYGHGIKVFLPLAEECGIRHFSVFNAKEALEAERVSSKGTKIMIMGMIDNAELEWAIINQIEFYVFELDRLEQALATARRLKLKAKIHLEVETGMNRTGFKDEDLPRVFELLKKNRDQFVLEGLCTHYAGAESIANYVRIKKQQKIFGIAYKRFISEGLKPHLRHTACSAATLTYPETQMDMVRIGILQYGFWPSKETFIHYVSDKESKTDPIDRLISWKSKVMSTKFVKTGEFIGYGTSYLADKKMRIATVPVGYAQGFSRSLSNQGRALVDGTRVAVVGRVNMNLMMIDITNLPSVKKGDEVVLIGDQNDLTISVASFADFSNQLNYELLTRLPDDIPRVTVE